MYRIAVIGEDMPALRTIVAALDQQDYHAALLVHGEGTIDRLVQAPPDVILLDLEATGPDFFRRLTAEASLAEHSAFVLLLPEEMLRRLEGGHLPDDFLLVPARPAEAVARVRLVLRRRTNVDAQNLLRCGDLVIDLANYKVTVGGQAVELTYKEYELLRFLMSNPAKVFTREQLLNRVWGYDYYGGARTVDVHIRRLRSKIELRPGQFFIETVRNVGYRFKDC